MKGLLDQTIIFPKQASKGGLRLTIFSEAHMVGDIDGRRSTSGVLVFLGAAIVALQSLKQKIVVLSICEAKYGEAATTA
jgi:hypothetical protein